MDQQLLTQILTAASRLSMKARAGRSSAYLGDEDKSLLKRVSQATAEAKREPDGALTTLRGPIEELAKVQLAAQRALRDSDAEERGQASGRLETLTGILAEAKGLVESLMEHGQVADDSSTPDADEGVRTDEAVNDASAPGETSEQPAVQP